jgi:hypothetical protein
MYGVVASPSGIVKSGSSEAGGFGLPVGWDVGNVSTLGHNLWMAGSVPKGAMEVMELGVGGFVQSSPGT